MNWIQQYPKDQKPELEAFALYIGGQAKELWEQLIHHCVKELGIFMKQGRWMMFPISSKDILDDYLKIVELKLKHS